MMFTLLLRFALAITITTTAGAAEFVSLTQTKKVHGELISVDYVHRTGQFRDDAGMCVDFAMPPYAIMQYRGVEADLREVPLGTMLTFVLLQQAEGGPARLVTTESNEPADPGLQKKFEEFTKVRGVAGWIDKTEGKEVTVTFFSGNPAAFEKAYGSALKKDKSVKVCVANDELRTWNPPVDGESGTITNVVRVPTDRFGCSGFQITARVSNMLEGFRRGSVVRVFLDGWKAQDQFYGESLMGYGFGRMMNQELVENVAKEYPDQFPFRTDVSNTHLPWFRLKPGQAPPPFSEHLVLGEWVKGSGNSGSFLLERTGTPVDFTLIPEGKVRHLNADATLENIPAGTRCRFHLYQDEAGKFTLASLVTDEFTRLASNATSLQIESIEPAAGRMQVSWQLPEVKNYNGDMERPPSFARSLLILTDTTKIWRMDKALKITDLKRGDLILVNVSAELPGKPSRCTEVWVGSESAKAATDAQAAKHKARSKR
ncbi:MAG: hypothetical protein JNM99_02505 [Verrucomicrobiaceae bacterium]|nr:hypothetical protein [Verrucomicrobiaceae bacterium]